MHLQINFGFSFCLNPLSSLINFQSINWDTRAKLICMGLNIIWNNYFLQQLRPKQRQLQ